MLLGNEECKQALDMAVKTQSRCTMKELQSGRNYVIGNIFDLVRVNPQIGVLLASEAYAGLLGAGIISDDEDILESNYSQLIVYGLALSNLFYVYDVEKNSLSLHTSSISIVKGLLDSGKIEATKGRVLEAEYQKWSKQVYSIGTTIKEGNTIRTLRLELQPSGKYTVTVPRSCINFLEMPIIPYVVMQSELNLLLSMAGSNLLKITMGNKVRFVSTNQKVLESVYDSKRVSSLLKMTESMQMGDSSVYLPSVGASVHTPGLTCVDLLAVDFISGASLEEVDLSEVSINYDKAKPFLLSKLNAQTIPDILRVFNIPKEMMAGKNTTEVKEYLTACIIRTFDTDVYEAIFRLGYSEEDYNAFSTPLGDCYQEVDIPSSVSALRARLDTGVYKIIFSKRDGKFGTIIGTNCGKLLREVYGKGYMKKFESEGVRLSKVLHKVMQTNTVEVESVITLCENLGLDVLSEEIKQKFLLSKEANSEEVVGIVERHINDVESRKTTKPNPDNVLIRNCFATTEGGVSNNYYRSIDFRTIRAIYKMSKD